MAHHKRRKPKHQRSGCLLCKYWKDEREPKKKRWNGGTLRREVASRNDLRAYQR